MSKIYKSDIYTILSKFDLPSYVKSADYESIKDEFDRKPKFYADPVEKKYPCTNKETTIISAALYYLDKNKYSKERQSIIEENFEKVASALGILDDYLNIKKQAETDYSDTEYALEVINEVTNEVTKAFPISNEKEAKAAINYLMQCWPEIAPNKRELIANNVLDICKRKNYNLGQLKVAAEVLARKCEIIDKEGIDSICNLIKAGANLIPDELLLKKAEYKNLDFSNTPVDLIYQRDIEYILDAMQDVARVLPKSALPSKPPEFYIYVHKSELEKAADFGVKLANNVIVNKAYLSKISMNDLKRYFNENELRNYLVPGAAGLKKLAESFDFEQADRFTKLLKEKNIPFISYRKVNKEIPRNDS